MRLKSFTRNAPRLECLEPRVLMTAVTEVHKGTKTGVAAIRTFSASVRGSLTDASNTGARAANAGGHQVAAENARARVNPSPAGSVNYVILNGTGTVNSQNIYIVFYGQNAAGQWVYFGPNGTEESVSANYKNFPVDPTTNQRYVPNFTLNQVGSGGIPVPSNVVINSGRILIGLNQPVIATVPSKNGAVRSPNSGQASDPNANHFYQLVEVTQNYPTNLTSFVNVDPSVVDQFGMPITMQLAPPDPTVPSGSGVYIHRAPVIQDYSSGAVNNLAPFQLDVVRAGTGIDPYGSGNQVPLRILAPQNVLALGPPTQQAQLTAYNSLNTYFDSSVNQLFETFVGSTQLTLYSGAAGTIPYSGKAMQIKEIGVDLRLHNYYVMQFKGGNKQNYNIYYPFFSTNTPTSEKSNTLYGAQGPPPPPLWWAAQKPPKPSLPRFASPSDMVFANNGVFADASFQPARTYSGQQTTLANLENQIVSALNRGVATSQVVETGCYITAGSTPPVDGVYTTTATVADNTKLRVGMNILGPGTNGPLTVGSIDPSDRTKITINSLEPIFPVANTPLTFAFYYARGATWNYYAAFFHNPSVSTAGLAYGFPFDDQGGTSTDISTNNPTEVEMIIG
jgi:hypothetical protein